MPTLRNGNSRYLYYPYTSIQDPPNHYDVYSEGLEWFFTRKPLYTIDEVFTSFARVDRSLKLAETYFRSQKRSKRKMKKLLKFIKESEEH